MKRKGGGHLDKGDGFVGLEVVVRDKVVARLARIGHANRGCKRKIKMVSGWVGLGWVGLGGGDWRYVKGGKTTYWTCAGRTRTRRRRAEATA